LSSPLANSPDRAVKTWAPKLAALVLATALALGLPARFGDAGVAIYLAFPIVLLAARWFGAGGAAWTVLALSVGLIWESAGGLGPFIGGSLNDSLLNTPVFLATLAVVGLAAGEVGKLSRRLAVVTFLVATAIGTAVSLAEVQHEARLGRARLEGLLASAVDQAHERVAVYLNGLQTATGLYAASKSVERGEWREFTKSMSIGELYPGINGVGVILPVKPEQLGAFIAAQRADDAPDFALKSVLDVRSPQAPGDEHFIITFIEPVATNAQATGLDVASEANRRTAALRARDTGKPALTDRIVLVQDRLKRPGFLLYVPFYKAKSPREAGRDQPKAFYGWIYVPLVADDFFRSILVPPLGHAVSYELFDGRGTDPRDLLVSDRDAPEAGASGYRAFGDAPLRLADHDFTIRWWVAPGAFGGLTGRALLLVDQI
jgi:CHASE1-domain containing sensor protein